MRIRFLKLYLGSLTRLGFLFDSSTISKVRAPSFFCTGLHFFSLFLPPGAPLALAPLLVPIELISYVFRVVALSVRLFANMMAGHTLLKILATFAWKMLSIGGIFLIIQLFPLAVIIAITGLELAIAFLQAYVWTTLTCLYLSDALNLH